MNKPAAMKTLGLAPGAGKEDAKKAYRILAKSHHPDRFAGNPEQAAAAENRMKDINAAFRYVLPLLPVTTPRRPSARTAPSTPGTKGVAAVFRRFKNRAGKMRARQPLSGRQRKNKRPCTSKPGSPVSRQRPGSRSMRQSFHTVLKSAAPRIVNTKPASGPIKPPAATSQRGVYQNYRNYMVLKKKIQGRRQRGPVGDIGRVEAIQPVQRVNPVGDD